MIRILLIMLLVTAGNLYGQQINWMTMNQALEAQRSEPKKIIMQVYFEWHGPCKMMDKNTFSNKDVVRFINKHFYPVKFNAEGTDEITYRGFTYTNPNHRPGMEGRNAVHFFADALRLTDYQSLVFFKDNSDRIERWTVSGYKTPQQLEIFLKAIASDDYLELTTREALEEYRNNFKGTF